MSIKILNDKGDWLVQVQRGGIRKTQRGTGGTKKARAAEEQLVGELTAEIKRRQAAEILGVEVDAAGEPIPPPQIPTLREYFQTRWLEHAQVVQNPTTRIKSEFPFKYLLYHIGDRRLDELLEPSAINAFV